MPSRMPFSSAGSRLGIGKFDSGPARLSNTSWLDLRLILVGVDVFGTKDDGGGTDEEEDAVACMLL